MWFDQTSIRAIPESERLLPATSATLATHTPEGPPRVAEVASVAGGQGAKPRNDLAAPDADGVARTPEAIEAVWSEATRRAVEIRNTEKPPTCAHCGKSEWTVSVTEPTGRKLHVQCWQVEANDAERKLNGE